MADYWEGDDGMAGRKRREWNKYIADYDKLRMFLRYISYGCYHKQYLARSSAAIGAKRAEL